MNEINDTSKAQVLLSDLYLDYVNSDISKGLTDEVIRKNVTDIYTKVNTHFSSAFSQHGDKAKFNVNMFLDGVMGKMQRASNIPKKYDALTINKIMEVPYNYKDDLLRMSMYFYIRTQEFKNIIEYKSNMLTYSNVLYPSTIVDENFDVDLYMKNLQFIKDYQLKSKLGIASKILVRDDVYFGYEITDNSGKNFIWKKLPSEFCLILGRDRFETYRVGFDMRYFDKFPQDLETFPTEFKEKYADYQKGKNLKTKGKGKNINLTTDWELLSVMELSNDKAFAFKFDESVDYVLPYFSGMFLDLIRLSDLKDIAIISDVADNYKLIHQEIPINKESGQEDDYLISGEFLKGFHDNLRSNIPEGVGALTSPMKVTAVTLKNNAGSAEETMVSKHVTTLLTQSGTSALLFNGSSTSAMGLNKNIQVDENMMFKVLRQYELFMRKRLVLFNKGSYKFDLKFLDHTHYNTEALFNNLLKAGQFGFNTEFEINAVLGRNQIDFINAGKVMDVLGLKDKMIPLKSSHVGDASTSDEVGGKKTEEELTEDGAKSRDRDL